MLVYLEVGGHIGETGSRNHDHSGVVSKGDWNDEMRRKPSILLSCSISSAQKKSNAQRTQKSSHPRLVLTMVLV